MDYDDFTKAPVSLSELRSAQANDGALWTPRDMLVSVLREIDAGKLAPEEMVLAYHDGNGAGFFNASRNLASAVGILELAKMKCFRSSDEQG